MVSHRGIKENPTKVDVIRRMNRPIGKKDVMKLTGMMAALGHFISKLGEKGLPFFKLLKKSDKFKWTGEADQTLEELKIFLTTPPVMVPPAPKETFLLYISASTQVVSAVLVAERPEEGHQYPVQRPVYYVSEVLSNGKVSHDTVGCIVKWSIELGEFDLEFCPRQAIKSQIPADFISEWTET
jgi:hypothetical protein